MKEFNFDISANSYVPYSRKRESCLVLGTSGMIYPGVRIENVAFPLTIPAIQAGVCSCLGNDDEPSAVIDNHSQGDISDFWVHAFHLTKLDEIPGGSRLYEPLIEDVDDVIHHLKKLCAFSVSDRSLFPVTALVETDKGFIAGVNIEFKEWNLGLCAERVALSRAIASGFTEFRGIHIYAPKSEYISPCGSCRQVLFELMPNQEVILHHDDESISRHIVSHLLPNGFITNSLKK